MKSIYILKNFLLIAITVVSVNQASSAPYTEINNEKMNCAIFKNGKLQKQIKCTGDGSHSGNLYQGGTLWTFKPIQGYGKISVDMYYEGKTDSEGNILTDDNMVALIKKIEYSLNEKAANIQYRHPKTYKLLTPTQVKSFENGNLNYTPYTCLYEKGKPQFEFCFDYGFYF